MSTNVEKYLVTVQGELVPFTIEAMSPLVAAVIALHGRTSGTECDVNDCQGTHRMFKLKVTDDDGRVVRGASFNVVQVETVR